MTHSIPDRTRTAVLSLDLQTAIVSIYAKGQPDFLPRAAGLLQEARAHAMPVIHIQVGFRPGFPEVSQRNQLFGAIKTNVQWQQVFQGPPGAIHPDVAPVNDEIVVSVVGRRASQCLESALTGSRSIFAEALVPKDGQDSQRQEAASLGAFRGRAVA